MKRLGIGLVAAVLAMLAFAGIASAASQLFRSGGGFAEAVWFDGPTSTFIF